VRVGMRRAATRGGYRASPNRPMSFFGVKLHRANAQRMCLMSQVDFIPAAGRSFESAFHACGLSLAHGSSDTMRIHAYSYFTIDQPSDHFLSCPFISGGQKVNVQ